MSHHDDRSASPDPSQDLANAVDTLNVPTFADPIPGIIPFGTVTVFAGAPGAGKTAMLAEWIVRMRDGRTIWGHPTNPATAYCYIAADRQWASHQQWFNAVGYPDIPRYSLADDPHFKLADLNDPSKALTLFHSALSQCNNGQPPPPGALVSVDPMSPLFIAGNPNVSRDVAKTLMAFSREARSFQVSIVATAHFGKQLADKSARYFRPQDRISGSGAFSGFSDTQIYLCDPDPPDHPFHSLGWNPRHRPPEEFPCQRNEDGLFIPFDTMREDATASRVLDCFEATGETSIAVIADRVFTQHGISQSTVKRALSRLLDDRRITRTGHGRATKYTRVRLH